MATPSLTALPLPLRPVRESDARHSGALEAASDDQLAAPPTTAMFLSGVSTKGYESHTKQGAGKTPMFDITREAHDRHGNPVCYERTGTNQRVKLRQAKEAWLRAHKARATAEDAEAPLTTEYRHLTSSVKPPATLFTPKFVKLDRQVRAGKRPCVRVPLHALWATTRLRPRHCVTSPSPPLPAHRCCDTSHGSRSPSSTPALRRSGCAAWRCTTTWWTTLWPSRSRVRTTAASTRCVARGALLLACPLVARKWRRHRRAAAWL